MCLYFDDRDEELGRLCGPMGYQDQNMWAINTRICGTMYAGIYIACCTFVPNSTRIPHSSVSFVIVNMYRDVSHGQTPAVWYVMYLL